MSSRDTQSILSQLEWDEGLSMPVANAANKSLEDEVQKRQRSIVADTNELEETLDRVNAMIDHLKNVRQELHGTQGLVTARGKEIETESHLLKIAQREEGRLKQEIIKLEKEAEELKEKKNMYENNIFKQTQKLEEMKSQMKWDQQALEAWLEESARKDEDAMTLQKYTRADDARVKELSLRMQKLTEESMVKRRQLDNELTDTQTAQIELDKTAEDFRNAHAERQELIQQWEYTIEQMQRRDQEMDLLAAHLARVKVEVRRRQDTITEKQKFLDNELENNRELEKKISLSERHAAKIRLDFQEAETMRVQFGDELETLKRTVDRTATDLEATRSQVTQLRKDCIDKMNKLEQARLLRQQLMEKLKKAMESTMTAEERASMMEKLLSGEETTHEALLTELKLLRELWFRKSNVLQESRRSEKNLDAEIQGSHAAMRNLKSKIVKLDTDALKQQEIIYNQDFAMQQLERRINRMMGESSDEEKVTLELKVQQLQQDLDHKTDMHVQLTTQLKRLSDDIRRLTRELEGNQGEKADLTSKIEGLNLYNDCSEKELKKTITMKQRMMVDENILKLEIKKLQENVNCKADTVMSLEKRRLQLETAMKERRNEIDIHKEMLQAQFKAADEERQQISAELHERISKIDKLKKRYEILMVSMAPPEGEEEKSQAYYVIKAAQEKEELQREGDDLDARIRKAEKEIRALENTLKLMNGRNEQYRKSFNKVTETSDEMEEKQQLEEQMRAVMDKFKYKRRQIRELQDDLQTMGNTYENLTRDEEAYVEMIEGKQARMAQLRKELEDQKGKIERVTKMNSKYSREVKSAAKTKEETPEERDFAVRETREFNKSVMKQIGDTVQQHMEIGEAVSMYFAQANLPAPVPGATRVGSSHSSLSSARSSVSSVQSSSSVKRPPSLRLGEDLPPSPAGSTSSLRSVRSQASDRSVRSQASKASSRR